MNPLLSVALGIGAAAAPIVYQKRYETVPTTAFALTATGLAFGAYLFPEYETPLVAASLGLLAGTVYTSSAARRILT